MNNKLIAGIGILLFVLSTYFSYAYFSSGNSLSKLANNVKNATQLSTLSIDPNDPKTEECPLNGKMLTKHHKDAWEARRPMGVAIENHVDSRPQSGLSNADIVFEAVAEGGITRFLAIFYCEDAPRIGPVRSARMYFLELLQGFGDHPLYSHVGGANTPGPADALGEIRELGWDGYNDLNQFAVPFPIYYRDYELLPNVATEHTMYSSTQKLWQFASSKRGLSNVDKEGTPWTQGFKTWKFKKDEPASATATTISFDFWTPGAYSVKWKYDATSNTYARTNGTSAHVDNNSKKQLTTKNLVVAFMKESPANDGYEGGHLLYKTTGSGKAIMFMDGKAVEGQWERTKTTDLLQFFDASGAQISFNRGQIFVEVVPQGNDVKY